MAITFPTSLDGAATFPATIAGTDSRDSPDHAALHDNVDAAVLALEAKVGIDSSAVATSLDYKVKNPASSDPGHVHTGTSLTLANNSVSNAILRDSAALSVIGRSANSSGDPADIAAGTNGYVLKRKNSVLGFNSPGWFDVQDYGATGDGVTDDSTAIQAAITAAAGGGIVFFPPPTSFYRLVTGLTNSVAGVTLQGANPQICVIKFESRTTYAYTISAAKCEVRGLTIYYNNALAATAGGAIELSSGGECKFVGNVFDGLGTGFYDNMHVTNGYGYEVTGCTFQRGVRCGSVYNDSVATPDRGDSNVHDNIIDDANQGGSAGFYWVAGGAMRFHHNKILGYVTGFLVNMTAGITTSGIYCNMNTIEEQTTYGIRILTTTGTLGLVQIYGNELAVQGGDGIVLDGAALVTCQVNSNMVAVGGTKKALAFANTVGFTMVDGNEIRDAATGIDIGASSNVRVSRTNTFTGCTTDVTDAGTQAALRTMMLQLPHWGLVDQTDAHGTLNAGQNTHHYHLPDAAATYALFKPVAIPNDAAGLAAGDYVLKWRWSSDVANNNVTFVTYFSTHADAATANVDVLNTSANYAVGATANKMVTSSLALSSVPAAGSFLAGYIERNGAAGGDTNTGQVSIWAAWIEYKGKLY